MTSQCFVYLHLDHDSKILGAYRNVQAVLNSLDCNATVERIDNTLAEIRSPDGNLGWVKRLKLKGKPR